MNWCEDDPCDSTSNKFNLSQEQEMDVDGDDYVPWNVNSFLANRMVPGAIPGEDSGEEEEEDPQILSSQRQSFLDSATLMPTRTVDLEGSDSFMDESSMMTFEAELDETNTRWTASDRAFRLSSESNDANLALDPKCSISRSSLSAVGIRGLCVDGQRRGGIEELASTLQPEEGEGPSPRHSARSQADMYAKLVRDLELNRGNNDKVMLKVGTFCLSVDCLDRCVKGDRWLKCEALNAWAHCLLGGHAFVNSHYFDFLKGKDKAKRAKKLARMTVGDSSRSNAAIELRFRSTTEVRGQGVHAAEQGEYTLVPTGDKL